MSQNIGSIKHKDTRAHIPSKEEAGYENANPTVQEGKQSIEYDLNPKYLQGNPIDHRGKDPELFWMNKYGPEGVNDVLEVDVRSLYRHEHIAPEQLIKGLYKITVDRPDEEQLNLFSTPNELFGNALEKDELDKVSEYYQHNDGWSNRLIQGDSLLVMNSLLEREGMAGQVQCIYIDPPYGIKYNSNWQMKLNSRNVKDGSDEHLTGEPEMIKAFRDTWELGVHSYLSYLRERLITARELLAESGSCFIQISDENVHLVRCLMDEVFGSENFVSMITYSTTSALTSSTLNSACDYIIWYGKNKGLIKYRDLYKEKESPLYDPKTKYDQVELIDGTRRPLSSDEKKRIVQIPDGAKIFRIGDISSQDPSSSPQPFDFNGKTFHPPRGRHWTPTYPDGMNNLANKNRVIETGSGLGYVRYFEDFPYQSLNNIWNDIGGTVQSRSDPKVFVVQSGTAIIQRCILMTTDPGDLVLDPTCGSGTTAYMAEHWGRRWITIDTSRIALNIAKTRLMTATFPYYHLYSNVKVEKTYARDGSIRKKIILKPNSEKEHDIRQGFVYEEVPRITLKNLANNEPSATENIYNQPYIDKKVLRVAGPFTVETLQNFEPISPQSLDDGTQQTEDAGNFEERIFEHLKSAGVKNGIKNEQAIFIRVERLADSYLHAEGFYLNAAGKEKKAYFHIGPKFGTVAKNAVNEAVKSCRQRGDADWLIILGFSFESDISNQNVTTSVGSFEVTKARMHDDLMQDGLLKKDKKAASFVTIGEPDVKLHRDDTTAQVEIKGLDIYDPIKDTVKARSVENIAYWMVDDNYDGSNFVVKQVFFCGGSKDEFKKWQKGLSDMAKQATKKKAEATLKIEIDEEGFDRLYGIISHPFVAKSGQKVAVRVISQFGEESMKVLTA